MAYWSTKRVCLCTFHWPIYSEVPFSSLVPRAFFPGLGAGKGPENEVDLLRAFAQNHSTLWNVSTNRRIFMQMKLIIKWKVFHEDSFWHRGTRQLENGFTLTARYNENFKMDWLLISIWQLNNWGLNGWDKFSKRKCCIVFFLVGRQLQRLVSDTIKLT